MPCNCEIRSLNDWVDQVGQSDYHQYYESDYASDTTPTGSPPAGRPWYEQLVGGITSVFTSAAQQIVPVKVGQWLYGAPKSQTGQPVFIYGPTGQPTYQLSSTGQYVPLGTPAQKADLTQMLPWIVGGGIALILLTRSPKGR